MVIYNTHQIIYSINKITLGDMNIENIGASLLNQSSATGPTHLERGQLIGKIQKERLTINIVGWHFSQLVWNRPSSRTCGKAPAHLENSKREDLLNSIEEINFIIYYSKVLWVSPPTSSSAIANLSGEAQTHLKKKMNN